MGQGVSTKKHRGLIFGYLKQLHQQQQAVLDTTDLLLDRPEWYGLAGDNRNEIETAPSRRPDSGYVEDNRLVKELAYVDTTYYLDIATGGELKNDDSTAEPGKLTFADILPADGSLHDLQLSCRHLASLSCTNLYYLTMVQKLDLSKNHLEQLPDAIGSLINLQVLHVQHNQLVEIPDTICGLVNLTEIDLAHNKLTRLSPYIGHLKKLRLLYLNHNYDLSSLPIEMGGLEGLTTLAVLHCTRLTMLPAELLQLPNLRRLRIASYPQHEPILDDLTHNPPSLLEICARQRIKEAAYYFPYSPKPCSTCGKPYFESYVSRRRLVERADSTLVMFEYRLCSSHWTDDQDRMRYIFSHTPQQQKDVLKFLPPIVDQQPPRTSRIYSSAHPSIEEEKIATRSWRPQRFFKVRR